ncbi:hypothetical protein [Haloplasma contractile]|uniref:Uncharacterized protein n=1 Tax=Haloplasma contractile SSD-17B TaxID=1033810 RepID=U2FIH3_9MOLU|nr:hypothetical protein [Haloplasma contractile]ERJ12640.1 hypothetical protein HLPCO_000980 [Haloplasma contractile SSD-17B]
MFNKKSRNCIINKNEESLFYKFQSKIRKQLSVVLVLLLLLSVTPWNIISKVVKAQPNYDIGSTYLDSQINNEMNQPLSDTVVIVIIIIKIL